MKCAILHYALMPSEQMPKRVKGGIVVDGEGFVSQKVRGRTETKNDSYKLKKNTIDSFFSFHQ